VEVPPRERGAKGQASSGPKIGSISGCLRSPITGSFLPSGRSVRRRNRFKKTLFLPSPKTARQRTGQRATQWSGKVICLLIQEGLPARYFVMSRHARRAFFVCMENALSISRYHNHTHPARPQAKGAICLLTSTKSVIARGTASKQSPLGGEIASLPAPYGNWFPLVMTNSARIGSSADREIHKIRSLEKGKFYEHLSH
jgi:hypothetical protein